MMTPLRIVTAALGALVGLACGNAPAPSIVLVSIDSLRADRLGCYGAERDTSPAIDALAAEGVRFDAAIAPTSWTLPSHVTLLTGLTIPAHRVNQPGRRIDAGRRLLAEHLRAQEYRTAAFVSAPFLHRAYGFDRGFELYENFQSVREAQVPPSREAHGGSHEDETAPLVVDAAVKWLDQRPVGKEPWFLFVHLWDVHHDFLPPAPYDTLFDPDYSGSLDPRGFDQNDAIAPDMPVRDLEYLRALYDGEIRWLDHHLERLFQAIREREPEERVIVALVSDHGDEFFEHGMKGHMHNLHEESVRVPWILRAPRDVGPGAISGVVGLEDVAPTLLGLAGQPPMPEATGRNLAAFLRRGDPVYGTVLMNLNQLVGLRGPGWKVILDGSTQAAVYYDLSSDPHEKRLLDARSVAPGKLELLQARLRAEREHGDALSWEGSSDVPLDDETKSRLRALGYVEEDDSF